jgi:hypothetical protein
MALATARALLALLEDAKTKKSTLKNPPRRRYIAIAFRRYC